MEKNIDQTMAFSADLLRRENIKELLKEVEAALEERGYNSVNQISGYLITNDPAYITSHKNARTKIQKV